MDNKCEAAVEACKGKSEVEVSSKAFREALSSGLRGKKASETVRDGGRFPQKMFGQAPQHPSTQLPSYPHPHEWGQIRGAQEGGEKEE